MDTAIHLDRDFKEFVESFVAHDVRFMIVGGYALAAHGHPRATGDLDAWIWLNPTNAQRVLDALESFGFGSLGLTADDFAQANAVIQLGHPPHRIDIITSIDGVEFDDAWERRMPVAIEGTTAHIIGRDDLIRNKLAAGRAQDIADAERLRQASNP